MKKVLAVAFVLAILSIGFSASAQIPYIQVYFDNYAAVDQMDCPGVMPATLSVFAVNFNMWIAAVEYMVAYPSVLAFTGDVMVPGAIAIGSSPSGITMSYPVPGDGFAPCLLQQVGVVWNCADCVGIPDTPIIVLPHPVSLRLRAIRWPDYVSKDGVGMTSIICQVLVPTQESTWGSVKSLYK